MPTRTSSVRVDESDGGSRDVDFHRRRNNAGDCD
jgi:hypothetical protein